MASRHSNESVDTADKLPPQLVILEELMVVSALARSVVALMNEGREKSEWGMECRNAVGIVADHLATEADKAYSRLDRFFSSNFSREA